MDKLIIQGNASLFGELVVPGAKNSALPIMASSLLLKKGLYLDNLPNLQDISSMFKLLNNFGIKIKNVNSRTFFDTNNLVNNIGDYNLVRKMRASILVLGPLLARFNKAKVSLPGGCAIGNRPIDIHLLGLEKLGVNFTIENGFVYGKVKNKLIGNTINFPFPSVGATENLIMAASLANGTTIINNAAREPEIDDLIDCLNNIGANIKRSGAKTLIVKGVKKLNGGSHTIISDRIVAGSYIIMAVMMNKKFFIKNFNPKLINNPLKLLKKMGANIVIGNKFVQVLPSKNLKGISLETKPYPGFPTDLQAQMMSLMSVVKGTSKIKENIFENRFMHISELNRMGASIKIKNDTAYIKGGIKFKGTQVMANDLRASMSLVLAALCAEGETTINRVYHLDRGYEKIEKTLGKCGPKINRIK